MPGGLGAGLGGRPVLTRSRSLHPNQMEELELSLEGDTNDTIPPEPTTPHEPLALDWSSLTANVAPLESLPEMPPLPPIESAPLGGPLSRSLSTILSDDVKFFRPVAKANGPNRRIIPTVLSAATRKRPHPEDQAEPVATAPPPTPPTAHMPPPAPRKKRRGTRPGTYMCLYKGELFECPHGCDIVDKNLLYDLLRR